MNIELIKTVVYLGECFLLEIKFIQLSADLDESLQFPNRLCMFIICANAFFKDFIEYLLVYIVVYWRDKLILPDDSKMFTSCF